MGILNRLMGRKNDEGPEFDWLTVSTGEELKNQQWIQYDENDYDCRTVTSPDGRWMAAFGLARGIHRQRLFIFNSGELCSTVVLAHPKFCDVANNGTVIVADRGDSATLGGQTLVFDRDGNELISTDHDSNVNLVSISETGQYAATVTLSPDCQTYIFDINQREIRAVHDNREGNKRRVHFHSADDSIRLFLSNESKSEPLYAIDLDGDIVWKSDRYVGDGTKLLGFLSRD